MTEVVNKPRDMAIDLFDAGASLYVTGYAGTGKSTLANELYEMRPDSIIKCAPTGVAATKISGQTIHSLFGLPTHYQEVGQLGFLKKSSKKALRAASTIFVDEASMIRSDIIEHMNQRLQDVMQIKTPFGGKQMVFFGDLAQLPPVLGFNDQPVIDILNKNYGGIYFFQAPSIVQAGIRLVELKHVYRQQGDQKFLEALNMIRDGNVTEDILWYLNQKQEKLYVTEETKKVVICSTNKLAAQINEASMNQLDTKKHTFTARIEGPIKESDVPGLQRLDLKVGARVMILCNEQVEDTSQRRFINGTMGVFKGVTGSGAPMVATDEGDDVVIPEFTWSKGEYKSVEEGVLNEEGGPIMDANGKPRVKQRLEFEVTASFTQFPLKPAWAMTIHKSQGQTFDHMHLNMPSTFAHGMAYVALSRATSLKNLTLEYPIKARDVQVDPQALAYHQYFVPVDTENLEPSFMRGQVKEVVMSETEDDRTLLRIGGRGALVLVEAPKADYKLLDTIEGYGHFTYGPNHELIFHIEEQAA